jgi:hypothetical protein
LFVGSTDGYLYKVHVRSGEVVWRFSAGEPISERPVAIEDRVYVPVQNGGLFCVFSRRFQPESEISNGADEEQGPFDEGLWPAEEDIVDIFDIAPPDNTVQDEEPDPAEPPEIDAIADAAGEVAATSGPTDGEELWWTPRVARILAVSPTHIYTLDKGGRMLILSVNSGALVTTIPTEHLNLSLVNDQTDRIYIGSDTGTLQCLHEMSQNTPVPYFKLQKDKPDKEDMQPHHLDAEQRGPEDEEDLFGEGLFDDHMFGEERDIDEGNWPKGNLKNPFGDDEDSDDPFARAVQEDAIDVTLRPDSEGAS